MFILRNDRTDQLFFGNERQMLIVCRNRQSAKNAIRELQERTDMSFRYERINPAQTAGLWFLRRRNGRMHRAAPGVTFAFRNEKDAWNHSGAVFKETSKILIPTLN